MPAKGFVKGDPRINRKGRPRKPGTILETLDAQLRGTVTGEDGAVIRELNGQEVLARTLVEAANKSKDPTLVRQVILMAQKEAREEALQQSAEQSLKERKLKAAAQKYELENEIRKQRAKQRAKKEDAETAIKRFKAEQEEIKTRAMTGEYLHAETVRYYLSFIERGITDCFAVVKKISADLKRLYTAGHERQAEKLQQAELKIAFENVIRALRDEMKKK
ncbi:MAG: hypothetical protein LBJ31_11855 [Treponema sp.]|jgi:hypothetical protein|nr:hypothetical protein [Treponema sp.]